MLEVKPEQKTELHASDEVSAGKLLNTDIKESDDGDDEAVPEKATPAKKERSVIFMTLKVQRIKCWKPRHPEDVCSISKVTQQEAGKHLSSYGKFLFLTKIQNTLIFNVSNALNYSVSNKHLPDPGIKPRSPALQANSLLSEPPGKPPRNICLLLFSLFHTFITNDEIIFNFDKNFKVHIIFPVDKDLTSMQGHFYSPMLPSGGGWIYTSVCVCVCVYTGMEFIY